MKDFLGWTQYVLFVACSVCGALYTSKDLQLATLLLLWAIIFRVGALERRIMEKSDGS